MNSNVMFPGASGHRRTGSSVIDTLQTLKDAAPPASEPPRADTRDTSNAPLPDSD